MQTMPGDCPACHSEQRTLLGKPELEGYPIPEQIPVARSVFVVRCRDCGLIFCDPMPYWDPADVRVLYDQDYFIEVTAAWRVQVERAIPDTILDYVAAYLPSGRPVHLLDIGAGQEFTSRAAVRRGWAVDALDFSPALVARLKHSGVDAHLGHLEHLSLRAGTYDAAVMNSLLEHLPILDSFMPTLASVVRPGGVVFCGVPNELSLYKRYLAAASRLKGSATPFLSPFQNPYHLLGFSRIPLEKLFRRHGFESLKLEAVGGAEQLDKYIGKNRSLRTRFMNWIHWVVLSAGDLVRQGIYLSCVFRKEVAP